MKNAKGQKSPSDAPFCKDYRTAGGRYAIATIGTISTFYGDNLIFFYCKFCHLRQNLKFFLRQFLKKFDFTRLSKSICTVGTEAKFCHTEPVLTHSFFQSGWHFPENPKIDGDTDPFLKSGKILNHHGARARICIFKK